MALRKPFQTTDLRASSAARHAGLGVFAIARSQEIKNAITGALMNRPGIGVEVRVGELKSINGEVFDRLHEADIVLVDIDVNDERELGMLHRIVHEHRGRSAVLATAGDVTGAGMRQLIRYGIDDFIPQPAAVQEFADAVDAAVRKVKQRRSADGQTGKVLAFMRAKGGMGATTLAVHTALALGMKRHRRDVPPKVCLLDLDLQFGDIALYLDLESKPELVEIIRTPQRLDGALLRSAMSEHKSGLFVLSAPAEPVPVEALAVETALRMVELARDEFDYVVLDLPMALTSWSASVLGAVDQLYMVTQLNVPAIRQTRRLLDILHDEGMLNLPVSIVLNRYVWRLSERARLQQSVKALGRPIDHYVPSDYRLALDAANRGETIFDLRRRAKLGRAITALARTTMNQLAARTAEASRIA